MSREESFFRLLYMAGQQQLTVNKDVFTLLA
jgi:hypothetical protein